MAKNAKPIDKTLFKKQLKTVGLTQEKLSVELGYSANWLAARISQMQGVPCMVMTYLEKVYQIHYESYAPQLVPVQTQDPVASSHMTQSQVERSIEKVLSEYSPVDYERLYKVIYAATLEAMTKALSEPTK